MGTVCVEESLGEDGGVFMNADSDIYFTHAKASFFRFFFSFMYEM